MNEESLYDQIYRSIFPKATQAGQNRSTSASAFSNTGKGIVPAPQPQTQSDTGLWNSLSSTLGMDTPGFTNTLNGLGGIGNIAGGLWNIYNQSQMLGLYKDQMRLQEAKYADQKQELEHMRAVRARNNEQFAKIQSNPNSVYYSGA